MSVPFKPHSVEVFGTSEGGKTKSRGASLGTVLGQVTPMTASGAYDQFSLEVNRPHLLMCDTDEFMAIGNEVVWNSKDYVIRATMPFIGFANESHCSVLLEALYNA